jgi:hypothetical protein
MGRDELDLLFVLGPDVPIARELYREWDAASPVWEGSRLCPEFVHLPTPGRPPSGLWAEMATEGIVLFERDLVVSRCLMGIRNRIAFGEFTRGQVRGRPYWIAREDDA